MEDVLVLLDDKFFTTKEIEFLRSLYSKVNNDSNKTKPCQADVKKKYKVIKIIATCKLCGTVTEQFFLMVYTGEGAWVKDREISEEDVDVTLQLDTMKTKVLLCWNCKTKLQEKSKEDLIDMIFDLTIPPKFKPKHTNKGE